MLRDVGRLPVQLAMHLPDWSAGSLLWCSAAHLSVCRVVLQIPRAQRTPKDPRSILIQHIQHVQFPYYMLAISSHGCHEAAMRKLLLWNLTYSKFCRQCTTHCE